MASFEGTSQKTSFQEALEAAIQKALASKPGVDRIVSYTVIQTRGRKGGIAGFNELTVEIDAEIH